MKNKNSEIKLGKYKHYKGKLYRVLGIVRHSETLEHFVLYEPLYEDSTRLWVRPLKMFMEEVEVKDPAKDGVNKKVPRFEYVGE